MHPDPRGLGPAAPSVSRWASRWASRSGSSVGVEVGVSLGVVGVTVELGSSVGSEPWVPRLVVRPGAGLVLRGAATGGRAVRGVLPRRFRRPCAGCWDYRPGRRRSACRRPRPVRPTSQPAAVIAVDRRRATPGVGGSALDGSLTIGGSVAFGSPAVRPATPSTTARAAVVAPAITTRIRNSRRRPRRTSSSVGHERDADPAGQRVQLPSPSFEEAVGGSCHRRPPRGGGVGQECGPELLQGGGGLALHGAGTDAEVDGRLLDGEAPVVAEHD